jgi:hypothetical protein
VTIGSASILSTSTVLGTVTNASVPSKRSS